MKKILIVLSILLLVGCGSQEKEPITVHSLQNNNIDSLAIIIESGNYIIVDVREKEEYDESHLKGAINIPYDTIDEKVDLDKTKKILVYCKSGKRSSIAYTTLTNLGYDVYDLGAYSNIDYLPKE